MAADAAAIRALYQRVAGESGGLARQAGEITEIRPEFLQRSLRQGVALVAGAQAGDLVAKSTPIPPVCGFLRTSWVS